MTTTDNATTHSHLHSFTGIALCAALVAGIGPACATEEDGRDGAVWDGQDPGADSDAPSSPDEVPTSPIYGGTNVASCGWPSTVELGGACTGTLVHPEVVIYAAHCGDDYDSIRFGEKISSGPGRNVAVDFCETYPGGGPGSGDDFAFCKLSSPVNDVPIVPIAMGCETDEIADGKTVTMVGFGEADTGPYGTKRKVTSSISDISNSGEVFIGGGGKDTCQGDSGGPVFMQVDDGSWRVFGITSYGGACGGGGWYSQMHNGIAWFEANAGVDLTPCHDADGTWNPGADCGDFPLNPGSSHGTWANGCVGDELSGPSASCGEAWDDGGDGGGDDGEPEPPPPASDVYNGSLSGAGDSDVQPNGNYYQAVAGTHAGVLDGPSGKDFDLFLLKWNGSGWATVASSASGSPDESISYGGTAGYYAWIVESYSGSGSYTLTLDTP
ncbi:MAG: trypsin-like serine protease [Deltaproteobacteria bacterium]|nr:trypsin-like serine protease [Nannocystaceae bacterium]